MERLAEIAGALASRGLGEDRAGDAHRAALDADDLDAAGEVLELDAAQAGAVEAAVDRPLVLGGEGGRRGDEGDGGRRSGQAPPEGANGWVD
ncbi:MAG TPA: hypothetical protein VGC00_10000 [Thermoanaerobaculia bacterium]